MADYSFTMIIDGNVNNHLDELFEAGCADATFGAVDGIHYADFDREAGTLVEAITSALHEIESVPGLRVRRVEPDDLVTAAEIAKRLHRTRESVRLLIAGKRGSKDFPPPVSHLRKRARLWRWTDVAEWAGADPVTVAQARLIAALNVSLELRNTAARLPEDARALVESLAP